MATINYDVMTSMCFLLLVASYCAKNTICSLGTTESGSIYRAFVFQRVRSYTISSVAISEEHMYRYVTYVVCKSIFQFKRSSYISRRWALPCYKVENIYTCRSCCVADQDGGIECIRKGVRLRKGTRKMFSVC